MHHNPDSRKQAFQLTVPLLFVFFLLHATEVQGQERFKAAPILGFNLSQVDGDDLGGYNRIGVAAGGRVAAILHPRWRIALELQYIQQGSSRGKNQLNGSIDKIALQFVEAPVMVQFLEWKFQINVGFSYGRLIQYRIEDITGADVTDQFNYNPNQFFILGGLSFFFTEKFGIDLRLSRALTDLQADEGSSRFISRNITVRFLYEI